MNVMKFQVEYYHELSIQIFVFLELLSNITDWEEEHYEIKEQLSRLLIKARSIKKHFARHSRKAFVWAKSEMKGIFKKFDPIWTFVFGLDAGVIKK